MGQASSPELGISPATPELHAAMSFGVNKMMQLITKESSLPGVEPAKMDKYREDGLKLLYLAPMIHGAANVDDLESRLQSLSEQSQEGSIAVSRFHELASYATRGELPRVHSTARRQAVAEAMDELAKNISLDEPTLHRIRALRSLRLGL